MALKELLEEDFKQSFMIDLLITPGIDIKTAIRRYLEENTIITVLSQPDILKVSDDGKNPFFNSLDEYCNHYGDKNHVPYINILQAFKYAKVGGGSMRKLDVNEWANCAEKWEIERMKTFMDNLMDFTQNDVRFWMYRYVIFRVMFRIYWDNFEKMIPKLPRFFKAVKEDKFLANNSMVRTNEALSTIYDHMKLLLEKIGVKE
jgi:hypothetical protein